MVTPAPGDTVTYYVPAAVASARGPAPGFRSGVYTGRTDRKGRLVIRHGGHYGPAYTVRIDADHVRSVDKIAGDV